MAHLQIKSYGLSDTTLEEIFLKVASNIHDGEIVREIQYEDITDHGRLVVHLFFSSLIHKCSALWSDLHVFWLVLVASWTM